MSTLAHRVETMKLAAALGVAPEAVSMLAAAPPESIRALRTAYGEAVFARHESRFRRIAQVAAAVPAAVSGRIAQLALPPALAARVAAVMDAPLAVRLAGSLSLDYLTSLSVSLDPLRAAPILDGIDDDTVVAVGQGLLARGEHLTLGRFVSVIKPDVAMRVVDGASGADLIQVALLAEDPAALDALIERIGDDVLVAAIDAAHADDVYADALTLVSQVSAANRDRLVGLIAQLDAAAVTGYLRSVHAHDAWAVVLPGLLVLDDAALARMVNVEATLADGVLETILAVAAETGLGEVATRLPGLLDEEHRAALAG
ncbi:hypothetical protein [Nocardioides sp. AE5]|uniref:hypothetical protein n=1 Tax=Nocardioides sp. AE5 TaxID=2962573 RepID=UPI0028813800|nr:hypothetical protein [Nocardioides sp. AE5]MDT0201393.1 hypothetical protein [Nocardioides sp. AE5]